jgi:hypothetical protein
MNNLQAGARKHNGKIDRPTWQLVKCSTCSFFFLGDPPELIGKFAAGASVQETC